MQIKEFTRDLFTTSTDNYLVHCISSDFVMGAGIAIQFRAQGVKKYLKTNYTSEWNNKGYALYAPVGNYKGVYNLITKQYYYQKPTYQTIRDALSDMKIQIPNDARISMPHIGCGLDRLQWEEVKKIIIDTFRDTDCIISICKL